MFITRQSTRRVEYLCQDESGTLFYVSADEHGYTYESFKLFVGNGSTMREIPVQEVRRYRDGGTTFISTPEETFFSPSSFNPELVPLWGTQELINLNKDNYDIDETLEGKVSITKRK